MFPSHLQLGASITRVQSRQTQIGMIKLNLGGTEERKRSSFLPATWEEDVDDKFRRRTSTFTQSFVATDNGIKEFCTGSKYTGGYNHLGMSGKGIYKFPHGVIYDGFFNKNGEFHGAGKLVYPAGQKVEGFWKNGKLTKGASCTTADDIPFATQYCKMPDRRFQIELHNEVAAVGQEYLTNAPNPPRKIKAKCYDTGEGFYDPSKRVIYDYKDPRTVKSITDFAELDTTSHEELYNELYGKILAQTDSEEGILGTLRRRKISRCPEIKSIVVQNTKEKWILENCRRAWEEPTGPRSDLFEIWTSGKRVDSYLPIPGDKVYQQEKEFEGMTRMSFDTSSKPTLYSFIVTGADEVDKTSITARTIAKLFVQIKEGDKVKPNRKLRIREVKRRKKRHRKNQNEKGIKLFSSENSSKNQDKQLT